MKAQLIMIFKRFLARRKPEIIKYSRSEERRRRAQEAIRIWVREKRWTEDATLSEVAQSLDIDKDYMSKVFRKRYGKCFLQWRKEMRIEEAKRIMAKDKNIPTALVADAVGISDKSNFKRQFRDLNGCTPAQWRLKQQLKVGGK